VQIVIAPSDGAVTVFGRSPEISTSRGLVSDLTTKQDLVRSSLRSPGLNLCGPGLSKARNKPMTLHISVSESPELPKKHADLCWGLDWSPRRIKKADHSLLLKAIGNKDISSEIFYARMFSSVLGCDVLVRYRQFGNTEWIKVLKIYHGASLFPAPAPALSLCANK